jgi:hypothetical protein
VRGPVVPVRLVESAIVAFNLSTLGVRATHVGVKLTLRESGQTGDLKWERSVCLDRSHLREIRRNK